MLPRSNRLNAEKDYARIFKSGRSVSGPNFSLRYLANRSVATRVGFVVGTKVSKKAVVRNLLKRRMREVVRSVWPSLAGGFDVALIARTAAPRLEFPAVRNELLTLLERARLLARNAREAKR